jgi:hypothetical protein
VCTKPFETIPVRSEEHWWKNRRRSGHYEERIPLAGNVRQILAMLFSESIASAVPYFYLPYIYPGLGCSVQRERGGSTATGGSKQVVNSRMGAVSDGS